MRPSDSRSGPPAPDQPPLARDRRVSAEPVLPEQSREDTDADWGEYTAQRDDERLRRDRPPHWDDF